MLSCIGFHLLTFNGGHLFDRQRAYKLYPNKTPNTVWCLVDHFFVRSRIVCCEGGKRHTAFSNLWLFDRFSSFRQSIGFFLLFFALVNGSDAHTHTHKHPQITTNVNGAKFHVYTHINRDILLCYLSQSIFTAYQATQYYRRKTKQMNEHTFRIPRALHILHSARRMVKTVTNTHAAGSALCVQCGWTAVGRQRFISNSLLFSYERLWQCSNVVCCCGFIMPDHTTECRVQIQRERKQDSRSIKPPLRYCVCV